MGARLGVVIVFLCIDSILNYVIITTIVDSILMGKLHIRRKRKREKEKFLIQKENRMDFQNGYECSGFSSAFCLRHWGIEAEGNDIYGRMPNKMKDGYVYPKGIINLLGQYGFRVTYCTGNLNALREEVGKGNPVIVMIRVYADKNWLHYVPVVGYDENYIYLAESLRELVNCEEQYYNRKVEIGDFEKLWNTAMLKMPFYRNTYMVIER